MIQSNQSRAGAVLAGLLQCVVLLAAACGGTDTPIVRSDVTVGLELSATTLDAGQQLAAALRVSAPTTTSPAGVQGQLRFDPVVLRYVGVAAAANVAVAVNARDSALGLLTISAAAPAGLSEQPLTVVFESRHGGPAGELSLQLRELVRADGTVAQRDRPLPGHSSPLVTVPTAGISREPSVMPDESRARASALLVGNGPFRYGDVNGSGGVTVGDVVVLLNASVGNITLLGDAFVVGNVAPSNAGSATLAPGTSIDGSRVISVADVVLVQRSVVDNTVAVVGTVVPSALVGPRVVVTPMRPTIATMTTACTNRIGAEGGPFAVPASGTPWPECIDATGRPMAVQFCAYAKQVDGSWVSTIETAAAARCQAELPVLQRGGF